MEILRLARAIAGFIAAGSGVALLVAGTLSADPLTMRMASAISGGILLGVSYALYRSLATGQTARRN
jgi:hypothetical protein